MSTGATMNNTDKKYVMKLKQDQTNTMKSPDIQRTQGKSPKNFDVRPEKSYL